MMRFVKLCLNFNTPLTSIGSIEQKQVYQRGKEDASTHWLGQLGQLTLLEVCNGSGLQHLEASQQM